MADLTPQQIEELLDALERIAQSLELIATTLKTVKLEKKPQ
jgi:hypothetical protein